MVLLRVQMPPANFDVGALVSDLDRLACVTAGFSVLLAMASITSASFSDDRTAATAGTHRGDMATITFDL